MATLQYTFAQAGGRGNFGTLPIYRGKSLAAGSISTSGTSALSTDAAPGRCVARITSVDSAHIVTSGSASPTASATDGFYVPSGMSIDMELDSGWKIAAITAS